MLSTQIISPAIIPKHAHEICVGNLSNLVLQPIPATSHHSIWSTPVEIDQISVANISSTALKVKQIWWLFTASLSIWECKLEHCLFLFLQSDLNDAENAFGWARILINYLKAGPRPRIGSRSYNTHVTCQKLTCLMSNGILPFIKFYTRNLHSYILPRLPALHVITSISLLKLNVRKPFIVAKYLQMKSRQEPYELRTHCNVIFHHHSVSSYHNQPIRHQNQFADWQ